MDDQKNTPLHWASFVGAELAQSYLIAWGSKLESKDFRGFTALHLSCKFLDHNMSNGTIKQLLLAGADRNALDNEGKKPVDLLPKVQPDMACYKEVTESRKILTRGWSLLADGLMIKLSYRKRGKNPMTLIIYYILMLVVYTMHQMSSFKVLRASADHQGVIMFTQVLFGTLLVLSMVVSLADPGYIKNDPTVSFDKLLDSCEPSSLCPVCITVRTPRSRHCIICDRCIDRYDHHCPWVNNCVGKGNFGVFYTFVALQTVFLLTILSISIICKLTISPLSSIHSLAYLFACALVHSPP